MCTYPYVILPRFGTPAPGAVALSAAAHEPRRRRRGGAAGLGGRAEEEDAAELGALEKLWGYYIIIYHIYI